MTEKPIKGNGTNKVEIDIGNLDCMNKPYVVDIDGRKVILRFKCTAKDGDFGKITLESAL